MPATVAYGCRQPHFLGLEVPAMKRCDALRRQTRETLHLAASATDRAAMQRLAEAAFRLAQEAEALKRAEEDARRTRFGRTL